MLNNLSDNVKLFFIFIVFIVGAYVTGSGKLNVRSPRLEGFENEAGSSTPVDGSKKRCPNLLIQKGTTLYLHNTNLATIPGVRNGLRFRQNIGRRNHGISDANQFFVCDSTGSLNLNRCFLETSSARSGDQEITSDSIEI